MTMKHVALSLAIALGLAAVAAPAPAQEGPKLYVFTSGSLGGFPKAALQMGGEGNIDWAPVSFYVLKHPKGNVIIDTGNNDKTITDPDGWWGPLAKGFGLKMTKDDAIPAQLAKIGLKTDDIKYVVVGHSASRSWRQCRPVSECYPRHPGRRAEGRLVAGCRLLRLLHSGRFRRHQENEHHPAQWRPRICSTTARCASCVLPAILPAASS